MAVWLETRQRTGRGEGGGVKREKEREGKRKRESDGVGEDQSNKPPPPLPNSLLERVLDDEAVVAHVEADQLMHASLSVQRAKATCSMQTFATWGLVRVNERDLNIDGDFAHKTTWGQDVNVYVIDTGIYLENEAFGGRAVWVCL